MVWSIWWRGLITTLPTTIRSRRHGMRVLIAVSPRTTTTACTSTGTSTTSVDSRFGSTTQRHNDSGGARSVWLQHGGVGLLPERTRKVRIDAGQRLSGPAAASILHLHCVSGNAAQWPPRDF